MSYPLTCAVPRTTPYSCRATPTHVAISDRLGGCGGSSGAISEPACEDCAKALQRLTGRVRIEPLTDAWRARACADPECEAGAFAAAPGGICPDCLERKADQESVGDGPRFMNLGGV